MLHLDRYSAQKRVAKRVLSLVVRVLNSVAKKVLNSVEKKVVKRVLSLVVRALNSVVKRLLSLVRIRWESLV